MPSWNRTHLKQLTKGVQSRPMVLVQLIGWSNPRPHHRSRASFGQKIWFWAAMGLFLRRRNPWLICKPPWDSDGVPASNSWATSCTTLKAKWWPWNTSPPAGVQPFAEAAGKTVSSFCTEAPETAWSWRTNLPGNRKLSMWMTLHTPIDCKYRKFFQTNQGAF